MQRLLLFITAAFLLAVASRAAAAPAMWVVRDADSEIYLFGTMHILRPDAEWRTPRYDDAYARASAVWFEADATADPAEVSKLVATYGVDPARTLRQKLSPSALRALKQGQVNVDEIDHLRPWVAAMMLQVLPMTRAGYSVTAGADAKVTVKARRDAKPVKTFESIEDQIRMFAALPEAVEVQYLEDVIEGRGQGEAASLTAAWLAGDVEALGPELVGALKADRPALYEVILRRRNAAWADAIAAEMAGSGVELVNVGALHMVGEDGLPAMLAARGFTVERVQ